MRHGVRRPQVAQAPRFAPRQRRVLLPYRSSHTRSWFAAYDTRLGPAAGIPGPAGLDNHRDPVTTSYHPGGEPGHTLIDTQIDSKIHEFNRRIGVAARFAQLGVLPDFTSAVAASAPPR
jgi:hypothetical protein